MRSTLAFAVVLLSTAGAIPAAPDAPAEERYQLQSNRWVNLHQRLLHEARFDTAPPAALAGEELSRWQAAVATYRDFLDGRSPIFDDELIAVNRTLSETWGPEPPEGLPEPVSAALGQAMPLYERYRWPEDDRANRFWIAVAEPMIASAGEELAVAHTQAYGTPFPTRIRVDVSPFAWQYGAYTVGRGDSAHAVISSTDPGFQGFLALESLVHEPSHAVVGRGSGAIGGDLTRLARELGVRPPHNLWHAILFYTAGELTRRALAERGVAGYEAYIYRFGMFEGAFRGLREALETHWQAYLDDERSGAAREEALRAILLATTTTAPEAARN